MKAQVSPKFRRALENEIRRLMKPPSRATEMDARQAVKVMATSNDRDALHKATMALSREVRYYTKTDTDGLEEWIADGDFTGRETPRSIAAEWDSLNE